jgi:hypothetical protein
VKWRPKETWEQKHDGADGTQSWEAGDCSETSVIGKQLDPMNMHPVDEILRAWALGLNAFNCIVAYLIYSDNFNDWEYWRYGISMSVTEIYNESPKAVTPIPHVYSMRSAGLSQLPGENLGLFHRFEMRRSVNL